MPKTDKTVRYAEGKTYDFSREPPMDTPAGHFTQMVELTMMDLYLMLEAEP